MSLGKLLTTGKSLVGLHDANTRYRLREGALPKFESPKNPFARARVESKMTPAETAAANLKKTQLLPVLEEQKQKIVEAVQPVVRDEVRPAVASEAAQKNVPMKETKTSNATPQAPAVVNSWLKKLNPMVWLGSRKTAEQSKSVIPRFGNPRFGNNKAPVQGELSLDNIKVMRNDLSEADVEVVPVKARPAKKVTAVPTPTAAPVATAAVAVPDLPPPRAAWEFLGERLIKKD